MTLTGGRAFAFAGIRQPCDSKARMRFGDAMNKMLWAEWQSSANDFGNTVSLLTLARRSLHVQGRITNSAQADKLNTETSYVLESCAIENHRREVAFAVATGYDAWWRLLDITLTKCFQRLPHDRRENMLFDLLHVLPTAIRSSDIQEPTAVLLSEAVLSCITKLREDRRHQVMLQSAGGDTDAGSLPAERLFALLRSILDCILDNNRSELVRGNLYASLINYFHLIGGSDQRPSGETSLETFGKHSMSMSMSLSILSSRDDLSLNDSRSMRGSPRPATNASALELGTLGALKSVLERLVTIISQDAIDGTEVWKTVAFMLLDSLAQLCRSDKSRMFLTSLVRYGILSNFVQGLKEAEPQIQYVLKPDPDDLNPLYVYESKMSFLIRMAQTRLGAEWLLEARIFPVLSQCEFLDTRPEADQSFMDQDSFLPSAIQRYHQLFMPALQLVAAMLTTLGVQHATASSQAFDLLSHRETIIILLKNDSEEIGFLLTLVPKLELMSTNSGFSGIHGAVLGLAARCLGNRSWSQAVKPQTDAEVLRASLFASEHGSTTQFDPSLRRQERLLLKALVEYLDIAQKRSLIFREYERFRNEAQDEVKNMLGTTEMVSLLLWRHLVSYVECDLLSSEISAPTINMKSILRLLPPPDFDSFKANAGKRLIGALARLSTLDLTVDTLGSEWQSYQGYIEIMSRRLRDTVWLHEALE
ncbi:uncharacterized protein EDB93DRAFT_1256835 [Suillus bovinus]|uniref:uncharacterized protein n=1 Tax=Suillus bovinus TaxID=48563 RepID=UPI001B869A48|nr:uncharacterized protein EDB93DRAFT_1256835 [Suillus bovinus]KAG2127910.1 hypothetical protein EDB93DRAFT_1256835 [Suillus bovinus]